MKPKAAIAPRHFMTLVLLLAGLAITGSGCVVAAGPGYVAAPPAYYVVSRPVVVAPAPVVVVHRRPHWYGRPYWW